MSGAGQPASSGATRSTNASDPGRSAAAGQGAVSKQDAAKGSTATQPGRFVDYSPDLVESTKGVKLLFFHANWCSRCQALEKDIKANGVPDGVTVFKVDYDSNQDLRRKYGVTIQTTVVRVDDKGKKVGSHVAYDDPSLSGVTAALIR